jgi:DNA-binding NarL/FixJ family response regulator
MTRVLVVDDQALVRTGFRVILDMEPDLEVVGEAADGVDAVSSAAALSPDVVLMDVRMPRLDGIEATRRIVATGPDAPRVLVLTTYDADEYVYDAMKAGAAGFILKTAPPEQLLHAVRTAAAGDAPLAPQIIRRLVDDWVRRPRPGDTQRAEALRVLTDREVDVLRLIAAGRSNAEIASELFVSEATVKTHVSRVFAKLGVRDRVQAVVLAFDTGLVTPGR